MLYTKQIRWYHFWNPLSGIIGGVMVAMILVSLLVLGWFTAAVVFVLTEFIVAFYCIRKAFTETDETH